MVIELRGVTRTYVGTTGEVHALRGIDLDLREEEHVLVTGPSGAGKSTLLHVAGVLDAPTRGSVRIDGARAETLRPRERAALRLAKIGFVFQHHYLVPDLTVEENVALPALALGVAPEVAHARAEALLARVGVAGAAGRLPRELSGGEQQRAGIARALVNRPRVILADEPTGNLDASNADSVAALLSELHREGAALLVVTHEPSRFPDATRIVRIEAGRIVH